MARHPAQGPPQSARKEGEGDEFGFTDGGLNEAVEQITSGKYDLTKAVATDSDRAELEDYRLLTHTNEAAAKILGGAKGRRKVEA